MAATNGTPDIWTREVHVVAVDKNRTVAVSWLDEDDKQDEFDDSLVNVFSTRSLPRNQLSATT